MWFCMALYGTVWHCMALYGEAHCAKNATPIQYKHIMPNNYS